jgi:predicted  nucleic acid-binding Zn-ribbon protein
MGGKTKGIYGRGLSRKLWTMLGACALAFTFVISGAVMAIVGGKQKTVYATPDGGYSVVGRKIFYDNGNSSGGADIGQDSGLTVEDYKALGVYPGDEVAVRSYYSIFGYDWLCVAKSGNIATFWMVKPMAYARWEDDSTNNNYFNQSTYMHGVLNGQYVSGDINGINLSSVSYDSFVSNSVLEQFTAFDGQLVTAIVPGNQATNNNDYGYDNGRANVPPDAKIWLPSYSEVYYNYTAGQGGSWGLTDTERAFNDGGYTGHTFNGSGNQVPGTYLIGAIPDYSYSQGSWLRSPYGYSSSYACSLSFGGGVSSRDVNNALGVRPAIHLDTTKFSYGPSTTELLVKLLTQLKQLRDGINNYNISQISSRLSTVEAQISALGNTYATDTEVSGAITAAINLLRGSYAGTLEGLQNSINNIKLALGDTGDIDGFVSVIDSLREIFDAIDGINDSLDGYATDTTVDAAIAAAIADLADTYTELIGALASRVGVLESALGDTSEITDFVSVIDSLQEIFTDITSINDSLGALDATSATETELTDAIDDLADTYTELISALASRVGVLESALGDTSEITDFVSVIDSLEEIFADITSINDSLGALDATYATETELTDAIAEVVDGYIELVNALAARVATLETAIGQYDYAQLGTVTSQLAGLHGDITTINASIASLGQIISAMGGNLSDEYATIADLNTAITNAKTALTSEYISYVQSATSVINSRLTALENSVTALDTKDGNFATQISGITADITQINNALKALTSKTYVDDSIADVTADMTALMQNRYNNLYSEIMTLLDDAVGDITDLQQVIADMNIADLELQIVALNTKLESQEDELNSKLRALESVVDTLTKQQNTNQKTSLNDETSGSRIINILGNPVSVDTNKTLKLFGYIILALGAAVLLTDLAFIIYSRKNKSRLARLLSGAPKSTDAVPQPAKPAKSPVPQPPAAQSTPQPAKPPLPPTPSAQK